MNDIADAIATGAKAYLARQSKTLLVIASLLAIVIWYFLGMTMAMGFVLGAFASALAGYVGMHTSIRANIRTAVEAKKGLAAALALAFSGGSVTGLLVVGLGLLVTAGFYYLTGDPKALIGLGFGGSLISVFARLGKFIPNRQM